MVEAPEGRDAETQTGYDSLIRHMLYESGKSGIQVSRELGRSDNFVWSTLRNKSKPRIDLLIKIARVCGYEVTIRGRGEEYVLDVDDENEIVALSGYDLKLDALLAAIGADGFKALRDFCSGQDFDRVLGLGIASYRKEIGCHVFYDSNDECALRCYYDADGNKVVEFRD